MHVSQFIKYNLLFFVLYVFFYIVQRQFIFTYQELILPLGDGVGTLIFFPHGIRVLACMVGGVAVLPGLFAGHILANELVGGDDTLLLSVISITSIYLPYFFLKNKKLSLSVLLQITVISSILNSVFHHLYLQWTLINMEPFIMFTYLIGDLLGALSLFYIFKYVQKLYINYSSKY